MKPRRFAETGKISAAGLAKDRPVLYDRKNNKNLAPRKARQGACVVGIFDDDDLEFIEQARREANEFKPQELNEANVQAIFHRCLAKEGENFYNVQVVGPELSKNPSDIVQLSGEKMEKSNQNIRYLLGQLKTIHLPDVKAITLQEGFFRYDNHVWTKDFHSLFQLYALALGCVYFRGFGQTKDGNITSLIDYNRCTPTLSPKDPAFPAWWEAHKAEWEG